ncbi:hypothetical protein [Streptomyces atratus]|uniref:hypothetical protein n=1 Tax=Streptomyces atratus TaxID=1893 RepID=UPI002257BE9E|nr:hypothetical protein [Streptomyces atratus]MCX5343848.1 hypothetical protein [Streptomyces atratus]
MSYGYPPPQPDQQPSPYRQWPQPGPGAGGFPQPPKKSRTGLIVTLSVVGGMAVLLALGVLIATSIGSNSSSDKSNPPSVEATEGGAPVEGGASDAPTEPPAAQDAGAEDDVRITSCELDSVTQWPAADVEIVNHSGARASYIVNVEFVDGDGTRHGEGLASSSNLDAGQKSVGKAQGLGKFAGKLTCKVAKVSRFPAP